MIEIDDLHLNSERETVCLGQDLARALQRGDCLALSGDLGAGKTVLARGFIRAVAADMSLEVPSPTFSIVIPYELEQASIFHFDLYRIAGAGELQETGFDEALAEGIAVVEWPENAEGHQWEGALSVTLNVPAQETDPGHRHVVLTTQDAHLAGRVNRSLLVRRFLAGASLPWADRTHLQGDASTRRYERIHEGGRSLVLMDFPAVDKGPTDDHGRSFFDLAHIAVTVHSFTAIGAELRRQGLSAPALIHHDLDAGLLLLEDLGTGGIVADGRPIMDRYEAATDLLAAFHSRGPARDLADADGGKYRIPDYDRTALMTEIAQFPDWYWREKSSGAPDPNLLDSFNEIWNDLIDALAEAESGWILRDYHSPNLMWLPDRTGIQRVGLLDFQDAVIGPTAYDVVSLAQDARVDIPPDMETKLVQLYVEARCSVAAPFDVEGFHQAYAILGAHRAARILGVFVRLATRDGKPDYLPHIPRVEDYLMRNMRHPSVHRLREWLRQTLPDLAPPDSPMDASDDP